MSRTNYVLISEDDMLGLNVMLHDLLINIDKMENSYTKGKLRGYAVDIKRLLNDEVE